MGGVATLSSPDGFAPRYAALVVLALAGAALVAPPAAAITDVEPPDLKVAVTVSVTSEPSAVSIVDDAVDAGFGEVTVRFAGPSGVGEYPVPPGAPPEVIAEEVEEMFRAVDTTVPPVESLTVVSTADRTDLAAVVAATETRLSGVADDLVGVRVLLSVPAVDDAVEVSDVATALDDITTVGDLAELTVSTPDAAVSADTGAPSEGAGPAPRGLAALDPPTVANDWPTHFHTSPLGRAYTLKDYCHNYNRNAGTCDVSRVRTGRFNVGFKWGVGGHQISAWPSN